MSVRVSFFLWMARFFGVFASVLLVVALSIGILNSTNSVALSSFVGGSQFLAPILASPAIAQLFHKYRIRSLLCYNQLLSAVTVAPIAIIGDASLPLVFVLLIIRGVFEAVHKNGAPYAIKVYFDASDIRKISSLAEVSRFTAALFASLFLVALIGTVSIAAIMWITVAAFLASAAFYFLMPVANSEKERDGEKAPTKWWSAARAIAADTVIRNKILFLTSITTCFQGYYLIGRHALPMKVYGQGPGGAVTLQIATDVSFLLGASIGASIASRIKGTVYSGIDVGLIVLAGFSMLLSTLADYPLIAAGGLCIVVIIFEVMFIKHYNDLLLICESTILPNALVASSALGSITLALITLLAGAFADRFGFSATAGLLLVLPCVSWIVAARGGLLQKDPAA